LAIDTLVELTKDTHTGSTRTEILSRRGRSFAIPSF
jgi:hypothetical protein